VDTPAWLVLGLEVDNPNPAAGGTTTATADLTPSSNFSPASCLLPDGVPVAFASINGSVSPMDAALTSGSAQTTAIAAYRSERWLL